MATGLENLKIYQMAKELEIEVYEITKTFPLSERFRSVDQLRRSSSSVTNCIAEENLAERYRSLMKAINGYIRFLKIKN